MLAVGEMRRMEPVILDFREERGSKKVRRGKAGENRTEDESARGTKGPWKDLDRFVLDLL